MLGDKTVDKQMRRKRAEALRDLATIFQVNAVRPSSVAAHLALLMQLPDHAVARWSCGQSDCTC